MRSLYEGFFKTYPPAGTTNACKDRPVVKSSKDAKLVRADTPPGGSLITYGGSFAEHGADEPCNPAPQIAPAQ